MTLPTSDSVSINGYQYYSKTIIEQTKNDIFICFGNCFRFNILKNKLEFIEKEDLECRLKALKFLKLLEEFKQVNIGKDCFKFDDFKLQNEKNFNAHFEEIESIVTALKYFGASASLDCEKLTVKDQKNINIIIKTSKNNGIVSFEGAVESRISYLKIANLKLLITIIHIDNLKYKLSNAFDIPIENCELRFENKITPCSIFCLLNKKDFETISNMNYGKLLKDLKKHPPHEAYLTKLNILLLEMLNAYNTTKKAELLTACKNLAEYIKNNDKNNDVYILNYLQCIKRERTFTKSEKNLLYKIRTITQEPTIQLGIAILLENSTDIKYYYSTLSEDNKKTFLNYPITALTTELL